jgi:hypothetical protein
VVSVCCLPELGSEKVYYIQLELSSPRQDTRECDGSRKVELFRLSTGRKLVVVAVRLTDGLRTVVEAHALWYGEPSEQSENHQSDRSYAESRRRPSDDGCAEMKKVSSQRTTWILRMYNAKIRRKQARRRKTRLIQAATITRFQLSRREVKDEKNNFEDQRWRVRNLGRL